MDEGYIKYECRWDLEDIVVEQSVIEEINRWRTVYYEREWIGMYPDGIGFGNISMLLHDSTFLISGSATGDLDSLSPKHYAIVEDYSISSNWIKCKGRLSASSESLSHAALYETDQQITRVVHIHSEELWKKYLNILPTTSEDIAYGTPEMALEMQNKRKEIPEKKGVIIMGGHPEGIIGFGNSFDEIFELFRNL